MVIFAADDEVYALKQLVEAIKKAEPLAEVLAFGNPRELLEHARSNSCDVAFLDVQMGELTGIEVAKQLKILHPNINIIFVTGYDAYMHKAIQLHASGYILKPATAESVKAELSNLLNPVVPVEENKLVVKCFGNFEVYADGKVLEFERAKTKELLAYLIDRRGAAVTSGEIRAVLWEDYATDGNTRSYLTKLKKDLTDTLKKAGVEDVFETSWNRYMIRTELISCDYYDYLDNKPEGVRAYNGEYMKQYSWGLIKNVLDADKTM